MTQRLILLGAGDFAREVIWLISEMAETPDWDFGGRLDDNPEQAASILRSKGFEHRVLGNIVDYVPQPQDRFVCTIGNPKVETCGHKADRRPRRPVRQPYPPYRGDWPRLYTG